MDIYRIFDHVTCEFDKDNQCIHLLWDRENREIDKIMNEEFVYYSYEVDIFSLGVVLFEVYFSKSPFQYRKGMNHVDFLYEILQAWNPFYDFDSEIKLDFDLLLDSEFNTLNNFWKYNTTIPFHEYTQDLGIISCMCFPNPKLRLNIQDVKKFLYL